ncbi:MAG: hypothetical protein ABR583_08880 [Gaiellaceae bacterium]
MATGETSGARRVGRSLLVLGGVVLAVVLFLVLRPGGNDVAAPTPTTTTTTSTAPATTTTTTAPPPDRTTVMITIRDGQPVGGIRRARVERGERVLLVVRSDVPDEVHLHGYDLSRDVRAGGIVRLAFVADVEGRFEVELEERHLQIAELEVTP